MKIKRKIIPGIYGIYSKIKNKWYIGESKDIFDRWSDHKKTLKSNSHHSIKLQRHYNKYGIQDLGFSILMTQESNRSFWEKFLIKCFDSYKNGFNCTEGGEHPPHRPYKKFILSNFLTGETVEGENLKQFSIERNVPLSSLWAVLKGIYNQTNGWYDPSKNNKPKPYKLIDPTGQEYIFFSIKEFAMSNNLNKNQLTNILNGFTKYHKGWHLSNLPQEPKIKKAPNAKFFKIVSPEGKLVCGDSLGYFAKTNGLSQGSLHQVVNGLRSNHKGWRRYIGPQSLVSLQEDNIKIRKGRFLCRV